MSVEVAKHLVAGEEWNIGVRAQGLLTPGGAYGRYTLYGFDTTKNEFNAKLNGERLATKEIDIVFQSGRPVPGALVGVTMESLLAVCSHRLAMLQEGPFPCYENAEALRCVDKALDALKSRTLRQVAMNKAALERGETPAPRA